MIKRLHREEAEAANAVNGDVSEGAAGGRKEEEGVGNLWQSRWQRLPTKNTRQLLWQREWARGQTG